MSVSAFSYSTLKHAIAKALAMGWAGQRKRSIEAITDHASILGKTTLFFVCLLRTDLKVRLNRTTNTAIAPKPA